MFAVIDCEVIHTKRRHWCIRKLFILSENGEELEIEFTPCVKFSALEDKYKRAFLYCKHHIHKLDYNPKHYFPCDISTSIIKDFIKTNQIDVVLYKGGCVEKHICSSIGIYAINIEDWGVPKASSHNPKDEVLEHLKYMKTHNLLENIKKKLYY